MSERDGPEILVQHVDLCEELYRPGQSWGTRQQDGALGSLSEGKDIADLNTHKLTPCVIHLDEYLLFC